MFVKHLCETMKTASVRELRQNFPRIMAWITDGEQVAVTLRRKVVARLVPEPQPERRKPSSPDFESISREIFWKGVMEGGQAVKC